jgi:hemerythrin-like metal-binding protein
VTVLQWQESLVVGEGVMDETHREFVELLNQLAQCDDADALDRLDAFLAHTDSHFAQEHRWMAELDYTAAECHEREHAMIMQTAQAVRAKLAAGEAGPDLAKVLALAVAEWFTNHAASMDAVLALYMKDKGYSATPGG